MSEKDTGAQSDPVNADIERRPYVRPFVERIPQAGRNTLGKTVDTSTEDAVDNGPS